MVSWRRTDVEGLAMARLDESDGWGLDAHEVVVGRSPHAVYYGIELSDEWLTRYVSLGVTSRTINHGTSLEVDPDTGAWWVSGRRRRALDGCVDVDIAAAPATNTIPIRRLGLAIGEEAVIRVAWVDVPSLKVVPAEQGYRRIGPVSGSVGLEAYEFWPLGGRTYRLSVDPDGLVVDYEDFATRIER